VADNSVRTPDFPVKTGLASTDTLIGNWSNSSSTNTVLVTTQTLFNNTAISSIRVPTSSPPANSTATGLAGTIVWDSGYVYVCVSDNVWKRVALASF